MLVIDRAAFVDSTIREWPDQVPSGALVVLNDTRVFKARLLGNRCPSGGRVELLLLTRVNPAADTQRSQRWLTLGKASKPLRPGTAIECGGLLAKIEARCPEGELQVLLESDLPIETAIDQVGHVPIPPYLGRLDEAIDAERYQTVFADQTGSVAAPTAGLHLSHAVLQKLADRGVRLAKVTLHVGIGTFRPVTAPDLDQHVMHEECYEVSQKLAAEIEAARLRHAPVIAVGTTVVRALESARNPERRGHVLALKQSTNLLIQPGYDFQIVDGLLTNFHMPKSTLLALVGAFVGLERLLEAYKTAIERDYRFLSYGDATWIPQRC
jgi:S-adenosylmethionine:tRNA ribosyltransferase-isomerase